MKPQNFRPHFLFAAATLILLQAFWVAPAFACGYGTSAQDCMHQQRDQAAREQADQYHRQQAEQQQQQLQQQYQQQDQETYDAASQARQRASENWVTSTMAVAYHVDANDVWAIWDSRESEADTSRLAIAACNKVMGNGCQEAIRSSGGSVAIALDQSGWLAWQWAENFSDAKRELEEYCATSGLQCRILHEWSTNHWQESADGPRENRQKQHSPMAAPGLIKQHAMIAWPEKGFAPEWFGKTWLLTGGVGFEASKKKLLERCEAQTKVTCITSQTQSDGVILQYRAGAGSIYWANADSELAVRKRMAHHCAELDLPCSVVEYFDAGTPRFAVIDGEAAVTNRSYLAVAWPKNAEPKWNNAAVVIGAATLDVAKQQAISHCEKESGAACVLIGEVDQGYRNFLALYTDEKATLRYYQDDTKAGIARMVKEDCEAAKVSCIELRTFDALKVQTVVVSRKP
jgi:hypothetical protein